MAVVNYKSREISCKIVYFGPSLGGKTTSMSGIHEKSPPSNRSDLQCVDTEEDRTLFFDYFSLDVSDVSGLKIKFQIYGVPGQVHYRSTRKMVLNGVDGIVFVVDSDADRLGNNLESFLDMKSMLAEYGYDFETIPLVFEWNKRDLENVTPVEHLERMLNKQKCPSFETVATQGKNIIEAFKQICVDVVKKIEEDLEVTK